MNNPRFFLALLLAPWFVPLCLTIFSIVNTVDRADGGSAHWGMFVVVTVAVSYAGLIVLGLPVVFMLRSIGWFNLPTLIIAGGLAGVMIIYALRLIFGLGPGFQGDLLLPFLGGAGLGMGVALVFGLVAGIPFYFSKHTGKTPD